MLKIKIMRFIAICTIIVLCFTLYSCSSDFSKGGIKGTVKYGEGVCIFDHTSQYYYNYTGMVYIISQATKDTFSGPYYNILKIADSTFISNGTIRHALDPGIYYLCLKEHLIFNDDNQFIVNLNTTTEKTFWIYKCI